MKKIQIILLTTVVFFGCTPEKKIKRGFLPKQPQQGIESAELNSIPAEQRTLSQFYPMPPEQPRLQLLFSFTDENLSAFKGGNLFFLKIKRPYDIGAVKGKIYISDRTYKKIIVVDLEKEELSQIKGDYESAGIWVTEDDYKYVADFEHRHIIVFDGSNKPVRIYHDSLFEKPLDVAVFDNRIYVVDINKHRVFILDKKTGHVVSSIGGIGTEKGKFYKPTHVIVDREGNLYVNDFFNFRIQKLDSDGNVLKVFGYPGDTLGAFARPKGISLDYAGHLYAVDAAFENVQIFDVETTDLLLFFGGFGLDVGTMYLPNGIVVDYANMEYFEQFADKDFKLEYLVYVGNTLGPIKLNVYGFGEWVGAPLGDIEDVEKQ